MSTEWKFKFPYYRSECILKTEKFTYRVSKKLDPISYWLIKFYHGEKKLLEMSSKSYLEKELSK